MPMLVKEILSHNICKLLKVDSNFAAIDTTMSVPCCKCIYISTQNDQFLDNVLSDLACHEYVIHKIIL